jgi:DNA-binding NarL/FixJ family response regulator
LNQPTDTKRHCFGIVAADPLRFLGLQTMFPEEAGVEIMALDQTTAQAVESLSLVVIDATCTELLFELMKAFQEAQPSVRLIVVGLTEEHAYVERVIGAGAKGYLTHNASVNEIRMAIAIVLDGSVWAPRKVLARLIERGMAEQRKGKKPPVLTPREKDVLRKLGTGSSNKEIAAELAIDLSAVKAHVGRLMRKVGVTNRTALSVEAARQRLLDDLSADGDDTKGL